MHTHRTIYATIAGLVLCVPFFTIAANKNMPPAAPPPDAPATRPNVLPPSESQMQMLPAESLPAEALSGAATKDAETDGTKEEAVQKSSPWMGGTFPYALLTVVALVLIGIGGFFYLRRNNLS